MKESYDRQIPLRCVVCGSTDNFEYNETKTFIKCKKCNKEYPGGYDELVSLNQANIQDEIDVMKEEVREDLEKDIHDMLKKALKGNKYIKTK